jgi:hypothetical protein
MPADQWTKRTRRSSKSVIFFFFFSRPHIRIPNGNLGFHELFSLLQHLARYRMGYHVVHISTEARKLSEDLADCQVSILCYVG